MSPSNFGGRSGVILDHCGTHGVWLEGSELRRLAEWWRAGGKLIYQQHEAERTKQLYGPMQTTARRKMDGSVESPESDAWDPSVGPTGKYTIWALIALILECFSF
jgi:Zn-finger nucleic acid-binding protein